MANQQKSSQTPVRGGGAGGGQVHVPAEVAAHVAQSSAKSPPKIKRLEIPSNLITPEMRKSGATALQLAAENLRLKQEAKRTEERRFYKEIIEGENWLTTLVLPELAEIAEYVRQRGEGFLDEEFMRDDVEPVQEIQEDDEAKLAAKETKIFTVNDRRKELQSHVDTLLEDDDPHVALCIEAAEVAFWVSRCDTEDELSYCIRQMVNNKVIVEDARGDVQVSSKGTRYFVHNRFDDLIDKKEKDPEILQMMRQERVRVRTKIRDAIRNRSHQLREEAAQKLRTKTEEFIKASTLAISEVLDETKTGLCGTLTDGGAVFFEVGAEEIQIKDVVGAMENGFANLQAMAAVEPNFPITVRRADLVREYGELRSANECPQFEAPADVFELDKARYVDARKFSWHTVREAIEYSQVRARRMAEGLNAKEFHIHKVLGRYKPDTEGFVYQPLQPEIKKKLEGGKLDMTNSQLEVERFEDQKSEEARIRVTNCNPEFKEKLEKLGCLNPNGFFEGDRFEGLSPLLTPMLRNDYGVRIDKRPKQSAKPSQPNGKQRIEPLKAKTLAPVQKAEPKPTAKEPELTADTITVVTTATQETQVEAAIPAAEAQVPVQSE